MMKGLFKSEAKEPESTALETPRATTSLTQKVEDGGVSARDFTMPRATILYKEKNKVRPGTLVNNITNEPVTGLLVPLFPFKNYVKFTSDLGAEWATSNRNDPRVKAALDNFNWKSGGKPEVTELLNFLIVTEQNYAAPMILSYKSTSLKLGRQYNTLFAMQCGLGIATPGSCQQYLSKRHYEVSVDHIVDGKYDYYHALIKMPANKHMINDPQMQQQLMNLANVFSPIVNNLSADTYESSLENTEV